MTDVLNEHALAQPLRPSDRASFAAEGIPNRYLIWSTFGELSILARERVVFDGGKFEFARYVRDAAAVQNAYVVPLFDECGDPIDILAFRPGGPAAVWLGRVGLAGAEQIWMPRRDLGNELDVHPDIVAWLRAGRVGVVLLNNDSAAAALAGVTLRVADQVYARRLRAALTRAPRVVVRADLVNVDNINGDKNTPGNRDNITVSGFGRNIVDAQPSLDNIQSRLRTDLLYNVQEVERPKILYNIQDNQGSAA